MDSLRVSSTEPKASFFATALFKERVKKSSGFLSHGSGGIGIGVVEAGVCGKIVEGTCGAGFGIRGGIDKAAYASSVEGASAHGAGLEGSVKSAVG